VPGLNDDSVERQEIFCHACQRYVQFDIDLALNGNHVLNCPNCGHEHCRVVRNGVITGERWDRRNGPTYYVLQSNTYFTTQPVSVNGSTAGVNYVSQYAYCYSGTGTTNGWY
jgi:hypothetical protein